MKTPGMHAKFQFTTYHPDRGLVRRTHWRRSRSFTKQYLQLLYLKAATNQVIEINDIGGFGRSISNLPFGTMYTGPMLIVNSPGRDGANAAMIRNSNIGTIGSGSFGFWPNANRAGIQLGTGTTAVTVSDYALITPIVDGTGSGQLEYLSCAATNYRVSGTQALFDIERLWRNSSGGTITIQESAIYVYCVKNNSGDMRGAWFFCILRDLVGGGGVAVADGEYLRGVYTLSASA